MGTAKGPIGFDGTAAWGSAARFVFKSSTMCEVGMKRWMARIQG